MTLLEVSDVESGYGDVLVIHGVDLAVADGEMVSVIGPNGAGKSTLLKTVAGLLPARSGTVRFDGEDITGVPAEEIIYHGICYVPQTTNIFGKLTVRENLLMGAWALDEAAFEDRVERVYDRFPVLEERPNQRAETMSGGQQQMLAMGAALMLDPDLLILDEPSAGLAPQLIDGVFEKIGDINDDGTAVLMVEQNARRALREADRGVVLDMGEDRFEGTGEELLESEEIAELYLGS
ncbi:ABC transporter ATP-binding protein [Halorussus rarus]|uniref:ABC transporter ATP-binding protein n=1 Tax=Halorussus TaxID=1070314 RepID=UPI000E211A26|nr:ABC transporter ATP-binding protein [Halorussus rarus]NHN61310.1 ABC transporter ATP-binding protein [Halorussus sp. JP-T4]